MWDWGRKIGEKKMRELLTGWVCVGGYRMDQQTAGDSGTPACTPRPFEGSEDVDELPFSWTSSYESELPERPGQSVEGTSLAG